MATDIHLERIAINYGEARARLAYANALSLPDLKDRVSRENMMNKDDTISAYRDFTEWCKENPSFDLDVRLHTHSGRIGDGGYISDETTRIAFAAWRAAIKADRQKRIEPELARDQPCGCVVCSCKNQAQCLGCGAKHCGSHEVGEIPNPVYADHIADAGENIFKRR